MAIEKPSETATHADATVGYWLSETDERKAIFERGRQAGYREGIEAAEYRQALERLTDRFTLTNETRHKPHRLPLWTVSVQFDDETTEAVLAARKLLGMSPDAADTED